MWQYIKIPKIDKLASFDENSIELSAKPIVSNLTDKLSWGSPLKGSAEITEISFSCVATNTKFTIILIFTMTGE